MSLELATVHATDAVPTVGLFFGGRSAEHEISIRSATTLHAALRAAGYWVVPIGIERSGAWRYMPVGNAPFPTVVDARACAVTLAPGGAGQLMACAPADAAIDLPRIDVAFPALHGPFGEDGCIQGFFETCGMAYVGAGVLGGAATMDKEVTKRLLLQAGLPVVPYRVHRRGTAAPTYDRLRESLGPALFVKPSSLGSSIGTAPAHDAASLAAAIEGALAHGDTVLIERCVDARELECAVIETEDGPMASVVGEIVTGANHAFYDYQAKYFAQDGARLHVPAALEAETSTRIREMAVDAFSALGCRDLARVDFFLDERGQPFINELNTLPGFTSASLYPRMLAATGIPIEHQVRRLVDLALARG